MLPLQFTKEVNRKTLKLSGNEQISLTYLSKVSAGMTVKMEVTYPDKTTQSCELLCRLDTDLEVQYFRSGGIMPFVVNKLINS